MATPLLRPRDPQVGKPWSIRWLSFVTTVLEVNNIVCHNQSWNFLLSHRNLRLEKMVTAIHLEKLEQKCDLVFCTQINRGTWKLHLKFKELHLNSLSERQFCTSGKIWKFQDGHNPSMRFTTTIRLVWSRGHKLHTNLLPVGSYQGTYCIFVWCLIMESFNFCKNVITVLWFKEYIPTSFQLESCSGLYPIRVDQLIQLTQVTLMRRDRSTGLIQGLINTLTQQHYYLNSIHFISVFGYVFP